MKEQRTVEEQGRKIQEQEATIGQLKKEVEALISNAKEQDAKIQSVNARVESARSAQLVSVP